MYLLSLADHFSVIQMSEYVPHTHQTKVHGLDNINSKQQTKVISSIISNGHFLSSKGFLFEMMGLRPQISMQHKTQNHPLPHSRWLKVDICSNFWAHTSFPSRFYITLDNGQKLEKKGKGIG